MKIRWSKVAPQLALTPALAVTFVGFFGAILWTVYLSFTASRRFPDYTLVGFKQYVRLFRDDTWLISLQNVVILAIGSLREHRPRLHPRRPDRAEMRGEGVFRTVFLYPLAVSLIVTGLVWRWMFNPGLGVENFLHSIGWDWRQVQLARQSRDRHVRHHPRLGLAVDRLLHGADAVGAEIDQHRDLAGGAARRRAVLAALSRSHHPDDEAHLPDLRHPSVASAW